MLDINLFRKDKGGNPDLIKQSQKKRNASVALVDEVIDLDSDWIKLRYNVDQLNRQINAVQKEITQKMKAKESCDEFLIQKKVLETKRDEVKVNLDLKEKERDSKLCLIGNIVHESVIDSTNEDFNEIVKVYPEGFSGSEKKMFAHDQVLEMLGGYDSGKIKDLFNFLERGARTAGHRGFYLLNAGVELNFALIQYGLDFLSKKGYTKIQTPFFMKKEVMAKTAQLEQFDEELYKVTGGEESYLIATSEQPISAFHMQEWFEKPKDQLPIKYAGFSTCFRKEAGAHGKDTWGVFRVHQFEKVEQFVLTEPDKSWEMFSEMISTSEEFMQSLGFKYRVVSIVSGALNNAASKKYDLEAWFPYQQAFKELVSCSNCTDYQSRRCGMKKTTEKVFVHCLNSTLCATERTMCCLIENYQTETGVVVPEVLRPYLGGKEFLPFTQQLKTKRE